MTNSPNNMTNRIYFPYLDVVRFIVAFMIIIYHSYMAWRGNFGEIGFLSAQTYTTLTPFGKLVNTFLKNFEIGVDIFFLLSGFLITYILIKEKENFGKIDVFKFIVRRTLRIWPLYFFIIAISPLLVSNISGEGPNYLANIFFVGNFNTIRTTTWTYPFAYFWSICIEEHFYLVWPFIIMLIPNKHLLKIFIGLIMFSIGFRIYSAMTIEYYWFTLYLHTFARMDVLVLGAIGAYFYAKKPFVIKLNRFLRYLIWIVLIVVLSTESTVSWDNVFLAGFKKYLFMGLVSVILLDYNFNNKFKHVVKPNSIFHYFGKVSYGIYMYGNIILGIIVNKILAWGINNLWIYIIIVTVTSLVIPAISYEVFEKQILKLKKRFTVIQTR